MGLKAIDTGNSVQALANVLSVGMLMRHVGTAQPYMLRGGFLGERI
jgi:hypothetical protein